MAQFAMGVGACHDADTVHERLHRATIAIMHDPLTALACPLMHTTDLMTRDDLLPELAGHICRAIIEPGTVAGRGPFEMTADDDGSRRWPASGATAQDQSRPNSRTTTCS